MSAVWWVIEGGLVFGHKGVAQGVNSSRSRSRRSGFRWQ